jgi:predicted MFS family arabinose efflux permease
MTDDDTDRGRMLRRAVILLGCYFAFVQLNRSGGGVLAAYLGTARGMSPTDIGAVMGTMFFASALVQLPTGILFDWIGPRRTLSYLGIVGVTGLAVFAVSDDAWGMMAGRFAIGLGHGGAITAIYLIAMLWVRPERVAPVTTAVVGISGGIGGVLATTPLALSLERFGLEATFLGIAGATAVVTVILFLGLRDRPPGLPDAPVHQPESLAETIRGLLVVMRLPELRRIFAMGFCFTAPFTTIGGLWAGPYFIEVQKLDTETASLFLLSLIIALHLGTYFYGPLERLVGSRKRLILSGVCVQIVTLGIIALWPDAPLAVVGVSLFVFGCAAPIFIILAGHARSFVPERRAGRAITCITLVGLIGVFLMQTGTGALIDLVARLGGSPVTAYRLVFASVIAILVVSAAIYRKQPEAPGEAR